MAAVAVVAFGPTDLLPRLPLGRVCAKCHQSIAERDFGYRFMASDGREEAWHRDCFLNAEVTPVTDWTQSKPAGGARPSPVGLSSTWRARGDP